MSWFEVIAAGDIVAAKKPAADIYFYALKEMALKPEECLAFEDSHNGILSTSGANLTTIITVNGYTKNDDFNGAAIVLDDMGEPDQGFTVLSGSSYNETYLNLNLLKKIHCDQYA
jgi:beta-phosphoglucomutase-like phosphatase (HAD superfamily)